MNFAAIFSFLHPMLSVVLAAVYVFYILQKDYSVTIKKLESETEMKDQSRSLNAESEKVL
ncbi:hypothetical protein [Bacillus sp. FJAT-44742]|uniref:hypothetical protein n=1 Tax=Bacillus sp. FJAT-44742 TaxID=2014005 RepID=UPI000C24F57D|nr:hypothetical protein [Bacillus sp. FJAT-44742]